MKKLEIVQLELKYCESCGGLWMRLRGSNEVYCPGCAQRMAGLPIRKEKGGRVRLPKNNKADFACAEGWTSDPRFIPDQRSEA